MIEDLLADFLPPNVEALRPYEPGMPMEEVERSLGVVGAVKLASNENPVGPSPRGVEAGLAALRDINRYPDGTGHRLKHALAERLGVPPAEIVLGGGSNELIELLVRTFCRPGVDEVVSHRYAFVMYKIACAAHGVTFREAEVTADLRCDVDAIAACVGPSTKIVFLPNPNNPTGAYLGREAFETLLERLPRRVILAVDEAYHEYAIERSDYPIAERYRSPDRPMIVTLRTFSKIYGLAGLRVGYAIGDPALVGYMNRIRMPFNVCSPGQEAARAALDDLEHVERSRRVNGEGLCQLEAGLSKLCVRAYPSAANFVLVDLGREAHPIYEALLRKGVIVRPLRPLGLERHVRISVGVAEENARTLRALEDVLG